MRANLSGVACLVTASSGGNDSVELLVGASKASIASLCWSHIATTWFIVAMLIAIFNHKVAIGTQNMVLGSQVRGARAILRLTVAGLASLAHVAPNTIVRIEADKG